MNVYQISSLAKPKGKQFPFYSALVAEDKVWDRISPDGEAFKGIPFRGDWNVTTFHLEEPPIPKPNFFNIGPTAFVCDEKARNLAAEAMEMSGEFLPIQIEGETGPYWIYNVTKCLNVVDKEKSVWRKFGPGRNDRMIEKPAFFASRFGEETLFKIPEDRGTLIYCVEFTEDQADGEFKALVEHHGLTGLAFKLVWTSETEINETTKGE